MRSFFITLLILIILVIGGGVLWIYLRGEETLRSSIEDYGPEVLGAPVKLNALSFSPFDGHAAISGLQIGNPEGYSDADAMSIETASIQLRPMSVLSDLLKVNEIRITSPAIHIEPGKGTTNLQRLQKNVEAFIGPQPEDAPATPIRIDDFYLTGAQVTVGSAAIGFSEQTLALADIHLEDIGGQDGIAPAQAAKLVFDALLPQIQRALSSELGRQLMSNAQGKLDALKGVASEKLEGVKDEALEKIEKQTEKLPGGLKEKADEAVDKGIGGLLGKKKDKTENDDNGGGL